jgi:hypothetical protein
MAKKEMGESRMETKKEMAADKKQDVSLIKKAFKQHDSQEHKGGKGTALKLRAGGKTNSDMLKMGRNLAKVANQRSTGRGG